MLKSLPITRTSHLTVFTVAFSVLFFGFLIYSPGFQGPFFLDSNKLYKLLSVYQQKGETPALQDIIFSAGFGRILSQITFYFNIIINDGISIFFIKLTNFFLHYFNSLLIWLFSYRLLKLTTLKSQALLMSTCVFCFWFFSPTNMSSVLYAIQRMNLLSTLFSLIALNYYIWSKSSINSSTTRQASTYKTRLFILSSLLLIATFCKENGLLIFIYILLIELFYNPSYIYKYKKAITLATLLIITTVIALNILNLLDYSSRPFTVTERLLTETRVIYSYILQSILPSSQSLGIYHDGFPISKSLISPLSTLWCSFVVASLLFISIRLSSEKRTRIYGFSILFFFGGHSMESTILPLEIYFEHRNYLPSLGIYIFLTAIIFDLLKSTNNLIRNGILGVFVLFFALSSAAKAQIWSDKKLGYSQANSRQYTSPRASKGLAQIYLEEGKPLEAITLLKSISTSSIHQKLTSNLQIVFIKCVGHIEITEKDYQELSFTTTKEIAIEVSQALKNISDLYGNKECSKLDIDQLNQSLHNISNSLFEKGINSWHIDYYISHFLALNNNVDGAISNLNTGNSKSDPRSLQYKVFLENSKLNNKAH